ncbi:MAG: hypothetical protein KBS41_01085 [Oscillospiraceae bacterium]|nr:hypothetical protein [Candidatus Equicaccousia limihippi]
MADKSNRKVLRARLRVLAAVLTVVLLLYTARAANLQIFDAKKYRAQARGVTEMTAAIPAPRGEIVDYYGRPVVSNRDGFDITFYRPYLDMDNINDTVISLMKLLSTYNCKWQDDLPITSYAPFTFKQDSKTSVDKLKKMLGLASYATCQNCIDEMIDRYSLQGYDQTTMRRVAGVRFTMEAADFSVSYPYIFAQDIGDKLMSVISEEKEIYKGVEITTSQYREYSGDSVAPHIIGSVGPIYAENWDEYKAKGYSYGDRVGISGIEKECEDYLRGKDGEITYTIDKSGTVIDSVVTKQAVAGSTLRLTLDKTVQKAAQSSLLSTIQLCRNSGVWVKAASAVVINVKSFGVMAAATCPTYTYDDLKDEKKVASMLKDDSGKPFFNRAFNGTYPPGSVFKPAVATTALQLNKVSEYETVTCTGKYKVFDNYQPKCMSVHGAIAMNRALAKSCNYYFYEMGRRVGITELNNYCSKFGLGQITGVEVGESKGILAGPSSKEQWYDGDTIQAAIGQSDNAFTPLQLATYAATIADGGTRYKTTLIDRVLSYDQTTTVKSAVKEKVASLDLRDGVLEIVKKGMLSVTEDGTGSAIFKNYAIKVGGKTGTAQVTGKKDHTVFIAFAPFDNPEIAVAVVIEHGESSRFSGNIIKSVLDAYFYSEISEKEDMADNKLLK